MDRMFCVEYWWWSSWEVLPNGVQSCDSICMYSHNTVVLLLRVSVSFLRSRCTGGTCIRVIPPCKVSWWNVHPCPFSVQGALVDRAPVLGTVYLSEGGTCSSSLYQPGEVVKFRCWWWSSVKRLIVDLWRNCELELLGRRCIMIHFFCNVMMCYANVTDDQRYGKRRVSVDSR